jgi:hypothetical protein
MQGMPKSREKSSRETHNMAKVRKKCSVVRMAKKAKGLCPNVLLMRQDGILSNHRSTEPCASGLKNRSVQTVHTRS